MDRKERVELIKLIEETKALKRQSSTSARQIEWLKAIAGTAGVVTAFVGLVGLFLSIWQYQTEEIAKRESSELQQINHSIGLLAEENPAKRLAGISSLESFMREGNPTTQKQVFSVLNNILSVESNKLVRDAIVSSIGSLDLESIDNSVKLTFLSQLVSTSNSLVEEGELRTKRITHPTRPENSDSIEARANSISKVITTIVRNSDGFSNFSGIYCVKCDFSNVAIKDADFSNTILYLANFTDSILINSDFDGADIENARFVRANLQNSKFTLIDDPRPGYHRPTYISQIFNREDQKHSSIYGPNFNCSDLRNADFSGHPIFGFASESSRSSIFQASFVGADLQGTNFLSSLFFGYNTENEGLPFSPSSGSMSMGEVNSFQFEFSDYEYANSFDTVDNIPYESDLYWLKNGFSGSSWADAELPNQVRKWLQENEPDLHMNFGTKNKCEPVSNRDGFKPQIMLQYRDKISRDEITKAIEQYDLENVFELVYWSAVAKKIEVYELPDHEKNILVAGRAYLSVKNDELVEFLSSIQDNNDLDILYDSFSDIGLVDLTWFKDVVNQIEYENMKEYSYEERLKAIKEIFATGTVKADVLEYDTSKRSDAISEALWIYINKNKSNLINSMRYNK